jgi:hypothetical protein
VLADALSLNLILENVFKPRVCKTTAAFVLADALSLNLILSQASQEGTM